jgi:hypothetical protein
MKKIIYEKPKLIIISGSIAYGGGTACENGNQDPNSCHGGAGATANCRLGGLAVGGSCQNGTNAQADCTVGTSPHNKCNQGLGG